MWPHPFGMCTGAPWLSPILLEDAQSDTRAARSRCYRAGGSGALRSVTPATTRACPVGGPGDTRRLGESVFRLHAAETGVTSRHVVPLSHSLTDSCPLQTLQAAPRAIVRTHVPIVSRASPFVWYSLTALRVAAASWVDRVVIHRRGVIHRCGVIHRRGVIHRCGVIHR